jgi:hypothetical protein
VIDEVLRGLDGVVGEIAGTLDPDDVLLIASDHGFQADPDGVQRKWTLRFDALVEAAGLDAERDGFVITANWRKLAVQIERGDYGSREDVLARWVELADSVRDEQGNPLAQVAIARTVYSDSTVQSLVQRAEDALWGASEKWYESEAHAVVVISPDVERIEPLWPDGVVHAGAVRAKVGDLFQPADFSGAHAPLGIFFAAGGPIVSRAKRGRISVLEIAPLIAHLAGTPVPDDLEASVPVRLLTPEFLAAHPVRGIDAATLPTLGTEAGPREGEGDLEDRLRSLGYAE